MISCTDKVSPRTRTFVLGGEERHEARAGGSSSDSFLLARRTRLLLRYLFSFANSLLSPSPHQEPRSVSSSPTPVAKPARSLLGRESIQRSRSDTSLSRLSRAGRMAFTDLRPSPSRKTTLSLSRPQRSTSLTLSRLTRTLFDGRRRSVMISSSELPSLLTLFSKIPASVDVANFLFFSSPRIHGAHVRLIFSSSL